MNEQDPEKLDTVEIEKETEIGFKENYTEEGQIRDKDLEKVSTSKFPKADGLKYSSFDEIEYDLKRLALERQIAWEELKAIKYEFKHDLKPQTWYHSALSYVSRLGGIVLLRKLFFRS